VNSLSDQQLLRDYSECRSEAAFAELVKRHMDFVYSASLRMVRDAHLAEDVTQGVFVALAQNARQLTSRPVLSGWLHRTTQNLAANAVRSDVRRRAREQEAAAMNEVLARESNALWEQIAPQFDDALGELSEADRDALLLRYFERKSAREIAQTLGTTEDAAQKRVSRAVERLRELFAKRGVTVGASGLVVVISANAVQAAPAGLAVTISTAASALAGIAVQTSPAIAATKAIAMTTLQKTLVAVVIAASLATPLLVQRHARATLREQEETWRKRAGRLDELRGENERFSSLLAQAKEPQTLPNEQVSEVLRLRGEAGRLQAAVRELTRAKTSEPPSREEVMASLRQLYVDRVNGFKQRFVANPAEVVPELQYLTDRDWLEFVTYDHHRIDPDKSRAMSNARGRAQTSFAHKVLEDALSRYGKDNHGQFPTDLSQLARYLKTPVDDSVLQGWAILPANSLPSELQRQVKEPWVITQKAPINATLDQRVVIGLKTWLVGEGPNQWGLVP
jgi:RNA polymerase sigma factor (sigma-70 family)